MSESQPEQKPEHDQASDGTSPRSFVPANFGSFLLVFLPVVLVFGALLYFYGAERLWWLFVPLAVVGLCTLEAIFAIATDRGVARLSPSARRWVALVVVSLIFALVAFFFIRRPFLLGVIAACTAVADAA